MSLFGKESDLTTLVRKCQKQDHEAWGLLVDRFSKFVYSIARRHRLNEEDAADVFQNTFRALHQSIDRLESPDTLPKWLAVTASRMSMRIQRNQGRTIPLEAEGADLSELLAAEDENAERLAIQACEARELRDAVARLGGRCAPLLEALYLNGEASYQEVSDQVGLPVGAVGPTRARCLEKLRKALEQGGFFN